MAMKDNEHQGDKKEESGAYITKRGQNMRRQDELQNAQEWVIWMDEEKLKKGRDLNRTETDGYLIPQGDFSKDNKIFCNRSMCH